jgi:trypsin
MKYTIVLCMLLSLAYSLPKPAGHPVFYSQFLEADKNAKIVGGSASAAGQFPYQCALIRSGSFSCGCWVINANTIGTAAHCIDGAAANTITVRCGSLQWNSGGQLVQATRLTRHENYNSATINNDVGLIKISPALTMNTNVQPVTMPAPGSDLADGTAVTATGWGRTSTNGAIPTNQQYVNLRADGRSQCLSMWGGSYITANMVCAGGTNNGLGICNGDSGGVLALSGSRTIVGTTSFRISSGCAYPGYPEVYARIGNYVTWYTNNQ